MKYFIKQLGEKDCAFTCLKMLLAMVHKNVDYLYLEEDDCETAQSLAEIIERGEAEGVTLSSFKFGSKESFLSLQRFPVMVPIDQNGVLHMVLVKRLKNEKVEIYDPAVGVYRKKFEEFKVYWTGIIVEITGVKKTSYKRKSENIISKKLWILTAFFQLFSFILLFSGLFFINENSSFIVPLLFFLGSFICQLTYNNMLMMQMKRFDSNVISKTNILREKSFKERYGELNSFKVSLIGGPSQIINYLIIIIGGAIILGINGYLNLINLFVICMSIVGMTLLERLIYGKQSNKIESLEAKILHSDCDNDELKASIKELQHKTYSIAGFKLAKRYIILFIAVSLGLLLAGFSSEISINFVLFHVYLYYQIGQTFMSLLDTMSEIDRIKWWHCLYCYLIHKNESINIVNNIVI